MTHAYFGLLVLDLVYVVVGLAELAALGLVGSVRDAARCAPLALVSGWASVLVVASLTLCAGLDFGLWQLLVLVVAVLSVAAFVTRRRSPVKIPAAPSSSSRIESIVAATGVGLLAYGLAAALATALARGADTAWDVWAFWLPKAESIYYFHGLTAGLGGVTTFDNPQYPPGIPATAATAFHAMGAVHPALLPLQQCILSLSFVGALIALLRPYVRPLILFPALALLVLAPEFWSRISTVLPDQTVGYCLAVTAVCWLLWAERGQDVWLWLATLFLAAAALSKTEGLLLGGLLAAVAIAAAAVARPRHARRALVLLVGPAAVVPWLLWLSAHGTPLSSDLYHWSDLLRPGFLYERLDRLGFAAEEMLGFVLVRHWLLELPLALVGIAVAARLRPVLAAAFTAWLVVGFLGLATVYWISPLDLHYYVETSAERVVATLPLVAGAVLPLLLSIATRDE
jgi:ABC-type multidrug transport system fused ATPase/permease subunit